MTSASDLHSERHGSRGPAIVLVHGGMCCLEDWRGTIERLAPDHRVLAVDLRAHGQSPGEAEECSIARWASDLIDLVDALGLAPAVLVGHSLASRIVIETAARRPALASGLILLDGSRGHGGFAAIAPGAEAPPPPRSLAEVLALTVGPNPPKAERSRVIATMSAAPPAVMRACVDAMREWDLARADAALAALPPGMPVLAIQSTYHDAHTPRRSLEEGDTSTPYLDWLLHVHSQTRVRLLPRTGHFSMLERPNEVCGLIRDFAASTVGRGSAG